MSIEKEKEDLNYALEILHKVLDEKEDESWFNKSSCLDDIEKIKDSIFTLEKIIRTYKD